jgi:hypothetical protein
LRVLACGVCRTDLHIVDGELTHPKLPLVLGHEIVGRVDAMGAEVQGFALGERVGVPWLGWTCGVCVYCRSGRENLCDRARFTGYTIDGGYAETCVADERFCFPIPDDYASEEAAPLLCAGLIGYRALQLSEAEGLAGSAPRLGLYGFGASAHIVIQVALHLGHEVHVVTRGLLNHYFGGTEPTPIYRLVCGNHVDTAQVAQRAGAKTLVLTHFLEQIDQPGVRERILSEVSRIYSGNVIWGEDLMEIPIHGPKLFKME